MLQENKKFNPSILSHDVHENHEKASSWLDSVELSERQPSLNHSATEQSQEVQRENLSR